jgi:hypothetical protein
LKVPCCSGCPSIAAAEQVAQVFGAFFLRQTTNP